MRGLSTSLIWKQNKTIMFRNLRNFKSGAKNDKYSLS